jgi:hypothetical protein
VRLEVLPEDLTFSDFQDTDLFRLDSSGRQVSPLNSLYA